MGFPPSGDAGRGHPGQRPERRGKAVLCEAGAEGEGGAVARSLWAGLCWHHPDLIVSHSGTGAGL